MSKPRLLDLFCGAGGAARGYADVGFEVVGVDIKPQPHYPYEFHQADVFAHPTEMLVASRDFDAIHASPPCHDFTKLKGQASVRGGTAWMMEETRAMLIEIGLPYIIENVPEAYMRPDYRLCGCMVGLPRLRRPRWFETSWGSTQSGFIHDHSVQAVTVAGGGDGAREDARGYHHMKADWVDAMGIDWMTRDEMSQAIPPAMTRYMGRVLRAVLTVKEMERERSVAGAAEALA